MILTCPECRTRYRADTVEFPAEGRKVRCAKCGHLWHHAPPEPDQDAQSEAAVMLAAQPQASDHSAADGSPATAPDAARQTRPSRTSWAEQLGLLFGWLALAAMIFLIGWTGVRFRQEIATLWPQSSSVFATFGVAVDAHGIAIDDWSYHREVENGQPVMVVMGRFVNRSSRELTVPPVRVSLTDDDQRELYNWTYTPPQPILQPGESLPFSMRLPSPPPAARHLQLRFAGQD
jgi:predicted Zn finger-like uncharacterized protein